MRTETSHGCPAHPATDAARYHAGDMEGAERVAFERHLAGCAPCREALDAQRRLDALVAQLPTYRAPLRVPASSAVVGRPPARRAVRYAALAGAVAAAVIAVLATDQLRRSRSERMVREAMAADAAWLAGAITRRGAGDEARARELGAPWLGFASCDARIEPDVPGVFLCVLDRDGALGRAGARAGDVLLEVAGRRVHGLVAMYRALGRHRVGDSVAVVYAQGGRLHRAVVRLTARRRSARYPFDLEWSPALIAYSNTLQPGEIDGATVFEVPWEQGPKRDARVKVVRTVTREEWTRIRLLGDFAYAFGPGRLERGDVLESIDGRPADGWKGFLEAYSRVGRGPIRIQVRRGTTQVVVTIPPDTSRR